MDRNLNGPVPLFLRFYFWNNQLLRNTEPALRAGLHRNSNTSTSLPVLNL